MLNSLPMGFYSASQLVQDAKRHGVEVHGVDVMYSNWDCTLEGLPHPPAVRLGLRQISGLKQTSVDRIMQARAQAPFEDAEDLARRAELDHPEMKILAGADALISLSGHRRQQVWDASALRSTPKLLRDAPVNEDYLELPQAPEGEEIVWDYSSTGLTLRRHPLALLRKQLQGKGFKTAAELAQCPNGRIAHTCGIVTMRQQPDTANGTIFVSLEDETGVVQMICWKRIREHQRQPLLQARLVRVHGTWQREGDVMNLIAGRIEDLTPLLGRLASSTQSRNFH